MILNKLRIIFSSNCVTLWIIVFLFTWLASISIRLFKYVGLEYIVSDEDR